MGFLGFLNKKAPQQEQLFGPSAPTPAASSDGPAQDPFMTPNTPPPQPIPKEDLDDLPIGNQGSSESFDLPDLPEKQNPMESTLDTPPVEPLEQQVQQEAVVPEHVEYAPPPGALAEPEVAPAQPVEATPAASEETPTTPKEAPKTPEKAPAAPEEPFVQTKQPVFDDPMTGHAEWTAEPNHPEAQPTPPLFSNEPEQAPEPAPADNPLTEEPAPEEPAQPADEQQSPKAEQSELMPPPEPTLPEEFVEPPTRPEEDLGKPVLPEIDHTPAPQEDVFIESGDYMHMLKELKRIKKEIRVNDKIVTDLRANDHAMEEVIHKFISDIDGLQEDIIRIDNELFE